MNYFTYKIKSDPTTAPLSTVTHNENMATTPQNNDADALIKSQDPKHPANLICSLCRQFYTFGWVTGTGGGVSIKHEDHIFLAPSGVEKELMQPDNIFVMDYASKEYIRRPLVG
jgi:methylthioribulose-1-phosphate dehydratase